MSNDPAPPASLAPPTRVPVVLGEAVLVALAGMTLFEAVKSFLFPQTTLWQSHTMTIVFSSAVAAVAALVAFRKYERLHQQLRAEMRERQGQEEALQRAAVLAERNRLAGEIHDTLSQGFTGIVIQLEAAEDVLEDTPEDVQTTLAHIAQARILARRSLAEARRSVWELRPHALDHQPLAVALADEVARMTNGTSLAATFTLTGTPHPVRADIASQLLRISQEAVTNVLRHARAHTVAVTLTFDAATVCLCVEDDGHGTEVLDNQETGFGLISMRERAERVGGWLTLNSRPGCGTTVLVEVPLPVGHLTNSANEERDQKHAHSHSHR